jgi:hypothetical protein
MRKPLCIDLFCGLGGWTEGFLAEGWDVIGFDIEQHVYGEHRYPAQLVLQDVRTLCGWQFKDVQMIVASSPCQAYSYMAMPWTKAKDKARWYRDPAHPERLDELNALFNAPKRIQREAIEAAGRFIPMIQENVRGAIPWVGRSAYHYGSFHLWGDVPALMPMPEKAHKVPGFRFDGSGRSFQTASVEGVKVAGVAAAVRGEKKGLSAVGFNVAACRQLKADAVKNGGDWFSSGAGCSLQRRASSGSSARKYASAKIAKIPLPLASHIARTFKP